MKSKLRVTQLTLMLVASAVSAPAMAQGWDPFMTACIPNCVCVTAEGCPCCDDWFLLSLLRPDNVQQNARVLSEVKALAQMDSRELAAAQIEVRAMETPDVKVELAAYYTRLAALHLPAKQSALLGILVQGDGTAAAGASFPPFEYLAYSACWYGGVLGGGDVVEVGDDCKSEWID